MSKAPKTDSKAAKNEKKNNKSVASIHPNYKVVKVSQPGPDGSVQELEHRFVYAKDKVSFPLSIHNHRAWSESAQNVVVKTGEVEKFNKKYGDYEF